MDTYSQKISAIRSHMIDFGWTNENFDQAIGQLLEGWAWQDISDGGELRRAFEQYLPTIFDYTLNFNG